jgi:predicted ribonuclease YlaK
LEYPSFNIYSHLSLYIFLHNETSGSIIDKFRYNNGFLNTVKFTTLGNDFTGIIKPRNPEQMVAFDMIKNDNSAVKLITGKWGSGKTLILCTAAIEAIMNGKFEKIVWIRNNV